MISIHAEMEAIAKERWIGKQYAKERATHCAQIASEKWDRPYTREQAAFPAPWTREHKFWPTVAGSTTFMVIEISFCSCPPSKNSRMGTHAFAVFGVIPKQLSIGGAE
jgi:glycine dehydrogenase